MLKINVRENKNEYGDEWGDCTYSYIRLNTPGSAY